MLYSETIAWLFDQIPNYQHQGGVAYKPGLENIQELLLLDGNPHKKLKFIHVAGTNGKGSVCNMLASVFQENGFKTGLFTSPHLKDFRERIRINGQLISEEFVVDYVEKNKSSWQKIQPSFFEITTAMAISAFAKEGCDICVMETGMGGRLDSTNIITPEISIITNIGFDHVQFLGDTLGKIAFEKAGIIKQNIPVIIGEANNETKPVFDAVAEEKKSTIIYAENRTDYKTDLEGDFQKKNLSTVLYTLDELKKLGWELADEKIKSGLENVKRNTGLKGRFQTISINPEIIVDAAHNKAGMELLLNEISSKKINRLHLIYGAVNDKDVSSIFEILPKNAHYYLTEFNSKRSLKKAEIETLAKKYLNEFSVYSDPNIALSDAKLNYKSGDLILICGSFFLIQEFI